jgi:hypothetical protein
MIDGRCDLLCRWNEFAEGGILAPTLGDGFMKIKTVAKVLGR